MCPFLAWDFKGLLLGLWRRNPKGCALWGQGIQHWSFHSIVRAQGTPRKAIPSSKALPRPAQGIQASLNSSLLSPSGTELTTARSSGAPAAAWEAKSGAGASAHAPPWCRQLQDHCRFVGGMLPHGCPSR